MAGAALDVHDVVGKAQIAGHRDGDDGEGFVDLDVLDVAQLPARARQRQAYRRDRTDAEHAGLDRGDAMAGHPGHRRQVVGVRPGALGGEPLRLAVG